ncbi:MAG: dihydrodipicolinate synthase family protein [FCB group bacterium]|jgi:N-acetylneuraminate lyase|nr:dihydrodipicolinate synthase family protein [FCB group bacterium]
MNKLTGLIAATFTPMKQDGMVHLQPIPGIVEMLVKNGVKGLYVCGSTGEGPSLTIKEREQVAQAYIEAVQGRIPVVVQVGHNCLEDARHLAKHAASVGADAISAVPPSYFIPEGVAALVETLARITDAAHETPFYYYHIPRLSGVSLDVPAFLQAAKERIPSLAGVKFSCRDIEVMQQSLAFENGRYNILFGVDEMLLSGVAAGCDGAVGSTYNFIAPLYLQIINDFANGNLAAAQAGQLKAAQLIEVILRYHGLSGLKEAMAFTGMPCGPPRLPLTPLTDVERNRMREELNKLNFGQFACREIA